MNLFALLPLPTASLIFQDYMKMTVIAIDSHVDIGCGHICRFRQAGGARYFMEHQVRANFVTAPPRWSVLEGLLVFCTAGLYLPVWFYLVARDIRAINKSDIVPLGWAMVPLVVLVQPLAFIRFFRYLRQAEKTLNLWRWPVLFDFVWMSVFFGCSVFFTVTAFMEVSTIIKVLVSLLSVLNFMLLHRRVNRFRKRCRNEAVAIRHYGYNALEWILVGIFTPLMVALFLYTYVNSDLHGKLPSKALFSHYESISYDASFT